MSSSTPLSQFDQFTNSDHFDPNLRHDPPIEKIRKTSKNLVRVPLRGFSKSTSTLGASVESMSNDS